jgi:hypothetical protein
MARKAKQTQLDPTGLSDAELDQLWHDWTPYRGISDDELVANALSGDDPEAARSLIFWLGVNLRDGDPMQPVVQAYGAQAFERFIRGKMTLGEAFGTERRKRGAPPTRLGARQAIISLLRFLKEERDFPLSESSRRPSAFLVAATLMQRRWRVSRSPTTLRDEYWNKRDKGK